MMNVIMLAFFQNLKLLDDMDDQCILVHEEGKIIQRRVSIWYGT